VTTPPKPDPIAVLRPFCISHVNPGPVTLLNSENRIPASPTNNINVKAAG
jgi:hypothetical protein